jgi:GGDEF domain-containing protein
MTEGHFTKLSDSYTFEAMKSVLRDFASRIKESVKTGGSSSSSDPKPCKT